MKWCEPYLAVMIIGWLSTQFVCFTKSLPYLPLGLVAMTTENSLRHDEKMVKLHFLHYHWSDVNHIWQLWPLDDCLPSLCVLWPVMILFGCHGNIKFKKNDLFLNDSCSKTTVSSVANFITAYEESIKPRLPFLIPSEFWVSKGNLFDVYYISLPLYCLHV